MKFLRQEVDAAVDALLLQQVILYPTDTVWGLGCDAESPPAYAAALSELVPGARVVEIAGAGHLLSAEAPDAVNELLRDHFSRAEHA